jgi:DNA-binding LytR/AlgR family response regulator
MYTCGIVEDEYLARKLLLSYIERFSGLEVRWAIETIACSLDLSQVDIVFLDLLDIPSSNSFATSEGIMQFANKFPAVVITTAYNKGYVENIGVAHVSILTKPYTYDEFAKVVEGCLLNKQ